VNQRRINLLRGTSVVSTLTLLSRVLGFIRDLLTARLLGAGFAADAFFVAFRIPNLLRSFVAEGALTSAFVPVFTAELAKGKDRARSTIRSITGLLLLTTVVLSLLGIAFSRQIVGLFAPGFGDFSEKSDLCKVLTQVMMPYIICVSLVAMLNAALNTVNIFGAGAMAQVWMNIVLIAGALIAGIYDQNGAALALSISVLIGGVLQVIVQIPAMRKSGLYAIPSIKLITPATKQIMVLILPAIVGATVYQLQIFLNTVLASFLQQGSVSWLFYADRLVQLPIGIFSIALASVLLPALSKAAVLQDEELLSTDLTNALRYTSFVVIPTATLFFSLAEPLIGLIFERGAFSQASTIQTARAVRAYSLGLWAVSCHSMLVRVFIAKKDTATPTLIGALTLCITVTLSLIFMGRPASGQIGLLYQAAVSYQQLLVGTNGGWDLGHVGLALASSLASFAALGIVAVLVQRQNNIDWSPFISATIKTILASAFMLLICKVTVPSESSYLVQLVVGLPSALVAFILASWAIRSQELNECWQTADRLLHKKKRS